MHWVHGNSYEDTFVFAGVYGFDELPFLGVSYLYGETKKMGCRS